MNLHSGSLLLDGRYRILDVLGQGGFGITYLAEQTNLGRKVAIKEFFMSEYCNRDPQTSWVSVGSVGSKEIVDRFRLKFIKEAQNIAKLKHKNIVTVIDIFEDNGTAYYVMEYLPGGTLSTKVKDRAMSEEDAVRYIRQVASALELVHSKHMMHLDVKPGNILIDHDGNAVLIDFGLSKQYDGEGQQTSTTPVGISHGYAPIEQYRRGGVSGFSPATDIYSLGATLYRLVTGKTPPEAGDILNDGLPELPATLSTSVKSVIECAMEPVAKRRPQCIADFMELLADCDSTHVAAVGVHDDCSEETRAALIPSLENDETPVTSVNVYGKGQRNDGVKSSVDNPGDDKKSNKAIFIVLIVLFFSALFGVATFFLLRGDDDEGDYAIAPLEECAIDGYIPVELHSAVVAAPAISYLDIKTVPSGAKVYIDGEEIGTSPVGNYEVVSGYHTVKILADGYKVYENEYYVDEGSFELPELKLERDVTALSINTVPSDAEVYVDGKRVGRTPIDNYTIYQGVHTVKIKKTGYKDVVFDKHFGNSPVSFNRVVLDVVETVSVVEEEVFQVVEVQPEFPGGTAALMKYLRDNIKYPRISRDNNSQGRAIIRFVVNSDGSIQDVEVFKSTGDIYLDKEAVRVVEAMPKWSPGKQSGKPVRVYFTLPVSFRLQ